ncbi:MAG: DNA repair protein RecO [Mariprofundaceae bacterium]|nr:DNA repair protein RecO [Mariprofundaceae bacterium]
MAEIRDTALLLRRIPYGDTSLIIHILAREHGRVSLMARGARRAKSPFRAALAPLSKLIAVWRPGRTGMGTLVDIERGGALLEEERSLEGLQLNALAAGLFREGEVHGYAELIHALGVLEERKPDSGILAGAWDLLQKEGWLGPLDYCWRCANAGDVFQWRNAELCCPACGQGMAVSAGLRKGILGHMHNSKVYLPPRDLEMWRLMIQDILRHHGLKPSF